MRPRSINSRSFRTDNCSCDQGGASISDSSPPLLPLVTGLTRKSHPKMHTKLEKSKKPSENRKAPNYDVSF
ncbi:hypothetical protein J2X69_003802 [Algoriphagus sp. 4150]|nr:hypothetical protein [Algoriphagus sp. 4150]